MTETKYAVLDIETSGLDPVVHEPIEVAYILLPEERVVNFSMGFDKVKADPKALEVNRYGQRKFAPEIAHGRALAYIYGDLYERVIIGKNVQFDLNFLREFLRRMRQPNVQPWHYTPVDLGALSAGALGLTPPIHTSDIAEIIGGRGLDEQEHTALGDALWNLRLWNNLRWHYLTSTT